MMDDEMIWFCVNTEACERGTLCELENVKILIEFQ